MDELGHRSSCSSTPRRSGSRSSTHATTATPADRADGRRRLHHGHHQRNGRGAGRTAFRPRDARARTARIGHRTMPPMLPDGRRLGAHLPLATGMVKAVERAQEIGASAMQIFTDNPTAWKRRAEPPRELAAFRRRLREPDVRPVSIHASYLVNLAGSNEESFERSIGMLANELRQAPASARGSSTSTSARTSAAASRRASNGWPRASRTDVDAPRSGRSDAERRRPSLAGGRSRHARARELGRRAAAASGPSIEELAAIADGLAARASAASESGSASTRRTPGVPASTWATPSAIDAFLAAFDDRIGLERLVMIHLNDSRSELGSRTDRHEHLGAGRIGPAGLATSCAIPAWPTPPTCSRRRAWTRGTTRSTWRGRARWRRDAPLEPLPRRRLPVAGQRQGRGRRPRDTPIRAGLADRSAIATSCRRCSRSPRSCASRTSSRAAPGSRPGPRHADASRPSCRTASCRCSVRRRRSATSTTAPGTTTC